MQNLGATLHFPREFDAALYRTRYADLASLTGDQLLAHYRSHGEEEGRACSEIASKQDLVSLIDTNQLSCLEIGPFDCPVLRGPGVRYTDVLDRRALQERSVASGRPYPAKDVPHIHYVDTSGTLAGIEDGFDVILSCHSIEHQPDLIRHLQAVSRCLNQGGVYVVIAPDKRFCFDHFIGASSIADVVEAYQEARSRHSLKSVLEHRALTCHNDAGRHWAGDHGAQTIEANPASLEAAIREHAAAGGAYLDVHGLQFTPASFRSLLARLHQLGYTDLAVEAVYPGIRNTLEFSAVLRKQS
jgi:SAM-dependent methyltransferase